MTNETITLNYDLLTDIEPGTDEFGRATLKMVMDFALQTINEITWLAAVANAKEEIDTPVVSQKGMVMHIASELYDQNVRIAEIWKDSYEQLYPEVVKFWLNNSKFCYITEELGLWVDLEELQEAMDAEEAKETA